MSSQDYAREFREYYLRGKAFPLKLPQLGSILGVRADPLSDGRVRFLIDVELVDGQAAQVEARQREDDADCLVRSRHLNVSYQTNGKSDSDPIHVAMTRTLGKHFERVEARRGGPPPLERWFTKGTPIARFDPERMWNRLELILFPTDACNLRCTYCIVPFGADVLSKERTDRMFELLDTSDIDDVGLTFLGGEPMMGWDCIERVSNQLASRGPDPALAIVTNGTLMTPERAAFMAEHRFGVTLSLDGQPASHAAQRLAKGDPDQVHARRLFERTRAGLGMMVDTGAEVKVNMVVTPETVGDLVENTRYLLGTGISTLTVSPAVGVEWGAEGLRRLRAELEAYAEVMATSIAAQSKAERNRTRAVLQWEIRRSWYFMGRDVFNPHTRRVVLGPDGRLFSDLYNESTAELLYLGHIDSLNDWADLPPSRKTVPQAMYERRGWSPQVLSDIQGLSRHLLEVLFKLDEDCFTDEEGARDLVGHMPCLDVLKSEDEAQGEAQGTHNVPVSA